jgi:VWFA-related protein
MRLLLQVVWLLLVPVALAGQAPSSDSQPLPIFRSGTTFVEVDVVVHDRDGHFIRDLSADEFSLFEDGTPQDVTSFALVDLPPPSARSRAGLRFNEPQASLDDSEAVGRVYAMLLDAPVVSRRTGFFQSSNVRRIRRLATQFLEEALAPEDRMSITYVQHGPLRVQDLTADRALLRGAIDGLGIPVDDGLLFNPSLASQIRRRGALAGYRALEEAAEALGSVNGRRRTILWIGGTAPWDLSRMDAATAGAMAVAHRDALRAAVRNNVAVYPVDPAGLRRGSIMRVSGLRDIAHETGGLAVVNTNNFRDGFQRIVRDNSTYYLLGYYPVLDHRDGRFHSIGVRVARPGARIVRARQRYFAPERIEMALAGTPPSPAAVAIAGLGDLDSRDPLRLRTTTWLPTERGGTLWIVGELDEETRREPEWANMVTAEVTVQAADSTQVFTTVVGLDDSTSTFAVRTPDEVEIQPGAYIVRARLRGGGAASLSEIDRITLQARPVPLGEGIVSRRGPTTGPRHVRTADLRFRRTEMLRLELPTMSEAEASARMLDRTGEPVRVPVQVSVRREGGVGWIVADVSLAPLAPGEYAIEVEQDESSRLTPFRVVP